MTTYADREASRAASSPVELYRFSRTVGSAVATWRYVNGPDVVTFNDEIYSPIPGLHRGSLSQTAEASTMQLEIELPRTTALAIELSGIPTPAPIELTLYRAQLGLADSEAKPIYVGEVHNVLFEGLRSIAW